MSIIRDLGYTVPSLDDTLCLFGGSTGNQLGVGTTAALAISTAPESGVNGRIVDRLASLFTKDLPLVAVPATLIYSSRGSTAADRKLTLGVKLQHGDSSGGGDMADYSTQSQPADKSYFSTARSSDAQIWDSTGSTGPFRGQSGPAYYDLRAAKRFIRAVHYATKNSVTTESTGDEGAKLSGVITFLGGGTPQAAIKDYTGTSTTT